MRYATLCCLFACLMPAQPQGDPVADAVQAYWKAHAEGRFDDAVARRDEARRLLDRLPADSPLLASWFQQVAQIYQSAGRLGDAIALAEGLLDRTTSLGEGHPVRVMLLSTLATYAQQDRNLLKAIEYCEKAVAAREAAPSAPSASPQVGVAQASRASFASISKRFYSPAPYYSQVGEDLYYRLAELYLQTGRKEAAAAIREKHRRLIGNDTAALGSFYEMQGDLDQAAAQYRKRSEETASDPVQSAMSWQSLSNAYQGMERYADAAAALQQAIALTESTDRTNAFSQTFWMRQNLAGILTQAGQLQAADRIYQQLLTGAAGGNGISAVEPLLAYSAHLSASERNAQSDRLLQSYLDTHPELGPQDQARILSALANTARVSGDGARADAYDRTAAGKQPPVPPPAQNQSQIGEMLREAQAAASHHQTEDALSLAFEAIDAARPAMDREQITSQVPSIAMSMEPEASADAERLFERLMAEVDAWSADSLQPPTNVARAYAQFLISHREHTANAQEAIERFRDLLVRSNGAGTGQVAEALRMKIELEQLQGHSKGALLAAQDLLAFEEAHNGSSSDPYLGALQSLAGVYQTSHTPELALPVLRQTITVADQIYPAKDMRRAHMRLNVARTLAGLQQLDEAERLAREAAAIGQSIRPSEARQFTQAAEEFRRMRNAQRPAAAVPAPAHWFQQ